MKINYMILSRLIFIIFCFIILASLTSVSVLNTDVAILKTLNVSHHNDMMNQNVQAERLFDKIQQQKENSEKDFDKFKTWNSSHYNNIMNQNNKIEMLTETINGQDYNKLENEVGNLKIWNITHHNDIKNQLSQIEGEHFLINLSIQIFSYHDTFFPNPPYSP